MIIRDHHDTLICIEQHEHAKISGQFVYHWREDLFHGLNIKPSVEFAVTNHDRSWIPLDRKPYVITGQNMIASFINYPLKQKIQAYRSGIEQVLQEDIYAAYLISCHYASFFEDKLDAEGKRFLKQEYARQHELKQRHRDLFENISTGYQQFHFDLLQFCDNLSLYLCMNEWGSLKEKEIEWFQRGFSQRLQPLNNEKMFAEWRSETEIELSPYPFKGERIYVSIPYKRLDRVQLQNKEAEELYKSMNYLYHPVSIVPRVK